MKTMKTEQQQKPSAMREGRRRLSLTQLDLARLVGCTESMVTKIETGRAVPHTQLKAAIARELGIHSWEVGT